ncbi:tail fiber domain-containing protein [Mucilaginibacter sp. cycad4]|uniref:tail fiber domain-containing protein n=1 Tax=Mucilaginibacter sp. cycad4 TaxID=3342096 RepID=UPI002AAB3A0B|nr:tail fiber domain-containing protein [Mucilaginibacter gossypii]WPV01752.1 tail fiber domain-containing protein [Mucilaginibacter gossypii]
MIKNKVDLKARFKANCIPTQADFEDLIESGINQLDDGVKRTPGDPLTIMAVGDTQELLSLSKSFDPKQPPAWKINLNPAPADAPANPGFNIANAGGESRLFIDEATGNVGIGNKMPKARLDVAGEMHIKGAIDVTGTISTMADINANGLINTKANIHADGVVEANVIVARDKVTAGGAVEANVISVRDKVIAGGAVEANVIIVRDKVTAGGAVEANVISVRDKVTADGAVEANVIIARDKVTAGGAVEANVITVKDKVIVGGAVEANVVSVKDKVIVGGAVEAKGVISTDGNIHAGGAIDANGLISTKVNIHADGAIDAKGLISTKGDIQADGNIQATGRVNIGVREANDRPPVKLDVHGTVYFEGGPIVSEFYSKQQGGYMNWNVNNGTGETTFINNSGRGPGGFMFYNYDGREAPLQPILPRYKKLLYLTADQSVDFFGDIRINGTVRVTSDLRIKKNLTSTNNVADLDILCNLQVTNYQHIDSQKTDNQPVKGLIAQQVEEVFPEAVLSKQEFVPDIYAAAENVTGAGNTVTFTMGKPHGLQNNNTLKLLTSSGEKEKVVTVTGEYSFTIEGQADEYKDALVYGKQVDDFKMLDYNRLFVLNISATQQLKIENEQLKAKNQILEAMLADFELRLSTIENLKN